MGSGGSGNDTIAVLRPVMVGVALLTIALGGALYYFLDESVVGIVVAAFGVVDLLTIPFVLRLVARNRVGTAAPASAPAEGTPAEPDRTYNPYARED